MPQSQIAAQRVAFVRLWLYAKTVLANIHLNISFCIFTIKHIVEIRKAPRQPEPRNDLSAVRTPPGDINLGRTLEPGGLLMRRPPRREWISADTHHIKTIRKEKRNDLRTSGCNWLSVRVALAKKKKKKRSILCACAIL